MLWVLGKAEHNGGEGVIEHSYSSYGGQEAERPREEAIIYILQGMPSVSHFLQWGFTFHISTISQ
jgi:hypothetical protein